MIRVRHAAQALTTVRGNTRLTMSRYRFTMRSALLTLALLAPVAAQASPSPLAAALKAASTSSMPIQTQPVPVPPLPQTAPAPVVAPASTVSATSAVQAPATIAAPQSVASTAAPVPAPQSTVSANALAAAPVAAPGLAAPAAMSASRPEPKGPMSRIANDTAEAVADLLPWVDRERKDERLDEVLSRVADELRRAREADPEWVSPAERELRALAKKLQTLPEPPGTPLGAEPAEVQDGPDIPPRPFRPRVAWPGGSPVQEVRMRPISPVTYSGSEIAPADLPRPVMALADPDAAESKPPAASATPPKAPATAKAPPKKP